MKIGGKALVSRTKAEIQVNRAGEKYTMTITSLPVGWHDMVVAKRLIQPQPPEMFVTDSNGSIVRLANKTIQTKPNFNDPAYREKADVWQRRYNSLAVCDLLREDETVTWESVPPDEKSGTAAEWEAFADGLFTELNVAGFTDSDIEQILTLGREISTSVDVEGALKRFLSSQGMTTAVQEV